MAAMAGGVADEVLQRPPDRQRPERGRAAAVLVDPHELDRGAAAARVLGDAGGERERVDGHASPRGCRRGRRRGTRRASAPSGRRPAQVPGLLGLVHQRQRQLHPGERRAQVVADARQHLGPLLDLPLDPRPHGEERRPRGAPPRRRPGGTAASAPCRRPRPPRPAPGSGAPGCAGRSPRSPPAPPRSDHQHQQLVRVRHREPVARHLGLEHAVLGADARRGRCADRRGRRARSAGRSPRAASRRSPRR